MMIGMLMGFVSQLDTASLLLSNSDNYAASSPSAQLKGLGLSLEFLISYLWVVDVGSVYGRI